MRPRSFLGTRRRGAYPRCLPARRLLLEQLSQRFEVGGWPGHGVHTLEAVLTRLD